VLTVAGSDPSGGAGLQADLKTVHQHGGYGAAVPTLITVQNTHGVEDAELLAPDLVRTQLAHLLADLAPAAAKTGALGSRAIAHVVGSVMSQTGFPWVVDPVWLPSRGRPLAKGDIVEAYKEAVIPRATLVTPNAKEASLLVERPVHTVEEAIDAAERISGMGANAVLVKGGHLEGAALGTDVLWCAGQITTFAPESVVEGRFHGTGCTLSAAIASRLAHGQEIPAAVQGAKEWLTRALRQAFPVGRGALPVNHLVPVDDKP
jgi:hydroxymethylpyrimidine/phosphomethylpyrimidine kinase